MVVIPLLLRGDLVVKIVIRIRTITEIFGMAKQVPHYKGDSLFALNFVLPVNIYPYTEINVLPPQKCKKKIIISWYLLIKSFSKRQIVFTLLL